MWVNWPNHKIRIAPIIDRIKPAGWNDEPSAGFEIYRFGKPLLSLAIRAWAYFPCLKVGKERAADRKAPFKALKPSSSVSALGDKVLQLPVPFSWVHHN